MQSNGYAAYLRTRGLRVTPQRIAVLSAVEGSGEHLSAEDVFERVRHEMPHISLATVYKTLTELRRIGRLRVLPVSGKLRYDRSDRPPHHHLVCERCRRVVDVRDGLFPAPHLPPEERMGFEILGAEVTFTGICGECMKLQGAVEASYNGRRGTGT